MAAKQAYVTLSSGFKAPAFGLGTYLSKDGALLTAAVKAAIKGGYRHIDTAFMYMNEGIIGQALKELFDEGVVKREDVFITTKLSPSHHKPQYVSVVLKKQLEWLKLDYVDLYLIHNPIALAYHEGPGFPMDEQGMLKLDMETKLEDTWKGMEELVKLGLTKSIGVSNFNESQLERIMKIASIKPAVNQVESQPYFSNQKLIDFCHSHNIHVMAYGPLGSPGSGKIANLMQDERLIKIGAKYGKSSAQVALRWQIQRGTIVIPKSENPARIADNFNIWDFELSAEDMVEIAKMDTGKRAFQGAFPGAQRHPEFPFTELLGQ